jgi:hypothetical protein
VAEDWQVFSDERAAIAEFNDGLPGAHAEARAFQSCLAERLHAGLKHRTEEDRQMSNEEKLVTASEILAEGWRLTEQSMALSGMVIPYAIEFRIHGANHIRATRVATLDDLAKAIDALNQDIERLSKKPRRAMTVGDEIEKLRQERASLLEPQDRAAGGYVEWLGQEIERLSQGSPTDIIRFDGKDIGEIRRDRASLLELQKRASRSGCPCSTTVIEALFPEVPVKKKTDGERAEIEKWLSIRKEAALKIDPETAEVDWCYAQTLDPYGVLDEWELPKEFHQVGRERFARSPGSEVWVWFHDLPDATRDALWERHSRKFAFPAGFEDLPIFPDDFGNNGRA